MTTEIIISKTVEPQVVAKKENYFEEWLQKQRDSGLVLFGRLEKRGTKKNFIFWVERPTTFTISISKLSEVNIHGVKCLCYLEQEVINHD